MSVGELAGAEPREVIEVHRLLEDWFNGELPKTEAALERFASVMAPDLEVVMPGGRVVNRAGLVARLHELHGWWSESEPPGRIRIDRLSAVRGSGELSVASYEEWQSHHGTSRGRVATAVFRSSATAPNGLEWLRLHETWLPVD